MRWKRPKKDRESMPRVAPIEETVPPRQAEPEKTLEEMEALREQHRAAMTPYGRTSHRRR